MGEGVGRRGGWGGGRGGGGKCVWESEAIALMQHGHALMLVNAS